MSYYAIMAVGLPLVIITGGIDISVGSIMALAALGGAAALQNLPAAGQRLPEAFTTGFMRREFFGLQPMPPLLMLGCGALGWICLQFIVAGRETYALAGLAAGLAGCVSLGRFGTASTSTGTGYELTVIAAALVGGASLAGGRGTALGALLGTLVIALIENGIP